MHHMGGAHLAIASARAPISRHGSALLAEGDGLDADRRQRLGMRHHGEGLRLHVPHRTGAWRGPSQKVDRRSHATSAEFLARIGYAPALKHWGLTVAYHSACSLQHGQRRDAGTKGVVTSVPASPSLSRAEPHICCGSAGTYNVLQPELATRLRGAQARSSPRHRGRDVIAAGNIGCITQLAWRLVNPWSTQSSCWIGWPVSRRRQHSRNCETEVAA